MTSSADSQIVPPGKSTFLPERRRNNRLAFVDGGSLEMGGMPCDLAGCLRRAVKSFPDHGIVYLQDDGSEHFQSYPELLREATHVLGGMQSLGMPRGQIMILQLAETRQFIPAFWACILGGFIPAPLAVPSSYAQANSALLKLQKSAELLGWATIITSERLASSIKNWLSGVESARLELAVFECLKSAQAGTAARQSRPEEIALLMVTSGSTGLPKAVPLTHSNLLCRSAGSLQMNRFASQDIALNWMPLDHVAGLIYFHLRDVFLGCTEIQVPTSYILHEPLRWLDCIQRFGATITFAPNFAYGLVNDRAAEIARRHWDLSSMRWILNGAEAIVARTARKFLRLLEPHNLPPDAMHPAWGMSETSSGVTYSDRFDLARSSDEDPFVEVGAPIPGFSMRIVDEHDRVIEERATGRLQVKGLTVMQGYYRNPTLNREVFTEDGWFKTGDLGYLNDGRLTITGREKDVIIINSINYYSHEIEGVVEQLPGIEPSFTAACGVRTAQAGTERLAIFFTAANPNERQWPALIQEIRRQVLRQVGVNPDFILPLQKQDIPKTEIGKIQRARLKAEFEAAAFDSVCQRWNSMPNGQTAPRNDLERQIARFWEEVTHRAPIGVDQNFFEMGGDSLQATRILSRVREAFQLDLTLAEFFEEATTVEAMAKRIAQRRSAAKPQSECISPAPRDRPILLSYPQQRIWFLDQLDPGTPLYNIPILIRVSGCLNKMALTRSLQELAERHEILRTFFPLKDLGPQQIIEPKATPDLQWSSIGADTAEVVSSTLLKEACRSFDLRSQPAWRARIFELSKEQTLLLLVFHQIVIDGWSLEILFQELQQGYLAALGGPDRREPLRIQCADFACWQRSASMAVHMEASLKYWTSQLAPPLAVTNLKPDGPSIHLPGSSGAVLSQKLNPEAIAALRQQFRPDGVSTFVLYLALFAVVLRHRTEQADIRVGTAVSGRQHLAVEKLIGFFVNTLVLRLHLAGNPTFEQIVRMVRETVLAAYTHQDAPYEEVVRRVQAGETETRRPLIRVWFGLQDPMRSFTADGVLFEPSKLDLPFTQFDLSLFLKEENDQWSALLEYNTDVFQMKTARLLLEHYAALLVYVSQNPGADLKAMLSVLDKIETPVDWLPSDSQLEAHRVG